MSPLYPGGPTLPQERRLVTAVPGPRSGELSARSATVARGVSTKLPSCSTRRARRWPPRPGCGVAHPPAALRHHLDPVPRRVGRQRLPGDADNAQKQRARQLTEKLGDRLAAEGLPGIYRLDPDGAVAFRRRGQRLERLRGHPIAAQEQPPIGPLAFTMT